MASNQTNLLLALRDTDSNIVSLETEVKNLRTESEKILERLSINEKALNTIEEKLEVASKHHTVEEEKLKEEERKISERRKALSAIGGNKSAKLAQRELDIAKRLIETLENNVISAMGVVEDLEKKKSHLIAIVNELTELSDNKGAEVINRIQEAEVELNSFKEVRKNSLGELEPRLASLYKRVESRYRGDAIAEAESGSCKCCFRSLPNQTFNQVMAGYNLLQCPGCSRILVHIPAVEATEDSPVA